MDSRTLLEKCRENDKKAWQYVYNYLISCLIKKTDIFFDTRDIAQETIAYWLNRGIDETQITNAWAFKNLLRMKANAIAIDQLRRLIRKKEEPLLIPGKDDEKERDNPGLDPVYSPVIDDIICEQTALIIATALIKENEACWQILIRYFEGKFSNEKSKDIAKEFGLKPNTFSTRVSRCLQQLRELPEYRNLLDEFEPD